MQRFRFLRIIVTEATSEIEIYKNTNSVYNFVKIKSNSNEKNSISQNKWNEKEYISNPIN